ncbi:putative methanogenesis marker protein 1 [Legionella massiliensis]|uniref:Putative methanogenesis marker protein 1 n=1 Tax=Legionella massiliensis TaxID=1034943 RepID=A0A078KT50_9GAMM|nr:YcaO-like family protein [Legionella massiliensis]CDZ77635.1 putative methanogenesis marker protein 1 [Legionella massiliensis]CEE13373.1 YcaO-like family protein [Legionella massiliensis]
MIDLGGTYRAFTPEETLAKVEPLLWDKFRISRVANITGLDHLGVPTYVAIRPAAKLLTSAQGKGLTHNLAKISAIMESIEGWHCENMAPPELFGSYQDLSEEYPLLELHPHINHGPFAWENIANLEVPWGKGLELLSGKAIYFPYTTFNVNTTYFRPGYRYFPPTTNGLASGNTREEAICHALFEVLERDFTVENLMLSRQKQVDLSSISSPHLLSLLSSIAAADLRLEVWDISTRLNIPAYLAILHNPDELRNVGMMMGTGAHFSSVVALSRAITEAIQARLTIISGSRDDQTPRVYRKIKLVRGDFDEIFAKTKVEKMPFFETKIAENFSFSQCLDNLLNILQANGFKQIIVYDHTREEFAIPVVHVMVPGLRYLHGTCFSCSLSRLS